LTDEVIYDQIEFQLIDILGNVVIRKDMSSPGNTIGNNLLQINIEHLTPGIYFVKVQSIGGIYTQKFVVEG